MGLCLSKYCNCYGTNNAYDSPVWNEVDIPIVYAVYCDERYEDGPYR